MEYQSVLSELQKQMQSLFSRFGEERVYEKIGLAGGIKIGPDFKHGAINIPVDTESMESATLYATLSTAPRPYSAPVIMKKGALKGAPRSIGFWMPSGLEPVEAYKKMMLENLSRLERGLNKDKI
ncbi:MAG: hypothetical protein V1678_02430 [Candidatus Aenigmatarchaeota archaeon]